MHLSHRHALITGVGPGLGASLARVFSRAGFSVGLMARSPEFIGGLEQEIRSWGGKALAVPGDVADAGQVKVAVDRMCAEFGPVDTLIHNASGGSFAPIDGLDAATFETAWRVAVLGAFHAVQELRTTMETNGGVILFTGATSAVRGKSPAFSSAKFALRGLAQSLARELSPRGIHVAHVIVDAGIADPPETDGDFVALPDSIARLFLQIAEQSSDCWTHELDLRPQGEEFFT